MSALRALLWDVDGTLAETERDGHRVAFNLAFEAHGLAWRWDEARYGDLLAVTGGRERLLHDMAPRADAPATAQARDALARTLHTTKNERYADQVRAGRVALRDGVRAVLEEGRTHGVVHGIVTTTSRANVDALLSAQLGADWRRLFVIVVCGEDVGRKKPDPEAYGQALAGLDIDPRTAVALEDSPAGAAAAQAAGVPVIVTRSAYFAHAAFDQTGLLAIGPGLHTRDGWAPALPAHGTASTVGLADIAAWRRDYGLM